MRRAFRIAAWIGGGILALGVLLIIASIVVVRTAWFQDYVRGKIVSVAEESTGGRVEIGSFEFRLRGFEATMTNFVLHGTEPPDAAPLFRAARVDVRLKLLAGLKKFVDLEYLGIEQPAANVIVFADGSSNVPRPKNVNPNKPALQTVVELAIHKFELTNGSFAFAERSVPIEAHGENLRAQLFYRAIPASYSGDLHIANLRVMENNGAPLHASFDAPVEIGKDNIDVKNARLATRESQAIFNASVSNMASPVIEAHMIAHVSLAELQRTTKVEMNACHNVAPCFADADIEARSDAEELRISKAKLTVGRSQIDVSGTKGNLHLRGAVAVSEMGRLFGESLPETVAKVEGDVQTRGWKEISLQAKVNAPLPVEYGYGGVMNATTAASMDLKARGTRGIRAEATIAIAPSTQGVPVSGDVHADYDGASNQVTFAESHLTLPRSHLDFSGVLGRRLDVNFVSTNLEDLQPALKIAIKNPPAKMRVALTGGEVSMVAQVDGPLASPQINGHVNATRFRVEERPFDHLNADFRASAANASLGNATITRQSLTGQLSASIGLRDWSASQASPVDLTFNLRNGDAADVLALTGESSIPIQGALTASARIHGSIGDPEGTIQMTAVNGSAYEQPFDRADVQVDLADRLIRLTSFDIAKGQGHLTAAGTYSHPRDSLAGGHAEVHVASAGVELSQLASIAKQRPALAGTVQWNAQVGADVREAGGETQILLTNLAADASAHGLRENGKNYGDLTAQAETKGNNVNFRVDSNLTGGTIHVSGNTRLPDTNARAIAQKTPGKDYPLTATVAIANVPIESALTLIGENFPARGTLALNGTFAGTVGDPTGEARIDLTRAEIYNEPITSLRGDVRLSKLSIQVSNLRAVSPAGDLTLNGSFDHPADEFEQGRFDGRVESGGLRMARIHYLQTQKPGMDGTIQLNSEIAGEVRAPNGQHEIGFSKIDGKASASGIIFNGHDYGNATLTATSRGGATEIRGDSNFAGSTIHAEGDAKLQADLPVNLKLTIANLRYSNLRGFLGGDAAIRPDVDGLLEANASVSGPAMKPAELMGNVEISRLEMTTRAFHNGSGNATIALKNDGPLRADFDHSTVRIQRAHITGQGTDVDVTGTAGFSATNALNLTAKATTDLNLLEQIDREVHASGAIAVDTVVRGSISQPQLHGNIQLKNASVNVESIPNGISNANGTIVLAGSTARIENLTAESGGGTVRLSGFGSLAGTTARYTLRADFSHVRTRYEGVSVVNTANLTISGNPGRGVISGTVSIERVGFNPQSDVGSILEQIRGSATPKISEEISPVAATLRLDVHIRTAPGVRFQTTFAQTLEATADLNLTGTMQQPGMVGRVSITQGDLIFFGNEYTVDRGTIAFYNPQSIDPHVNISLATTVENINVTLSVSGPMGNLKLNYVSDPPLRFDEIVALLAVGTRPSSDPNLVANQAASPQQSTGEMGASALVGQTVSAPLANRLQRVFGVTQLKVDPTFANGSALPTARVTLQERVSSAITFTYSQDLSVSNSELIRVEYAFNPRFSAVATRDENGIFGVDFFYKRQFR